MKLEAQAKHSRCFIEQSPFYRKSTLRHSSEAISDGLVSNILVMFQRAWKQRGGCGLGVKLSGHFIFIEV
jgi:hypothetical protein